MPHQPCPSTCSHQSGEYPCCGAESPKANGAAPGATWRAETAQQQLQRMLEEGQARRRACLSAPSPLGTYTWLAVPGAAEPSTLQTSTDSLTWVPHMLDVTGSGGAGAGGNHIPGMDTASVAPGTDTQEWQAVHRQVRSFAAELATLAARVAQGAGAEASDAVLLVVPAIPAELWSNDHEEPADCLFMRHQSMHRDLFATQVYEEEEGEEQPQAAADSGAEAGDGEPRLPIVTGARLADTETGVAVLQLTSRRALTVGAVRDAMCVGALVDVGAQPATPRHAQRLRFQQHQLELQAGPSDPGFDPAAVMQPHQQQQQQPAGASARHSSWLCCAGAASVRTASSDDTAGAGSSEATTANSSSSGRHPDDDDKQLQFLVGYDGSLHVVTIAGGRPCTATRVERAVLTAFVWSPAREVVEVVTVGGERHGIVTPSEESWARLVVGLNAALLLADVAAAAMSGCCSNGVVDALQALPVRDMAWSLRVEGVLD
jgi:hypothetical protein